MLKILRICLYQILKRRNENIIALKIAYSDKFSSHKIKFNMKKLANKTVIITGGVGGIGKTTAKLFLEEGCIIFAYNI